MSGIVCDIVETWSRDRKTTEKASKNKAWSRHHFDDNGRGMMTLDKLFFCYPQPFLGGGEFTNAVSGKIKLGKETLATIDGHWDSTVMIKEKKSGVRGFHPLFLHGCAPEPICYSNVMRLLF